MHCARCTALTGLLSFFRNIAAITGLYAGVIVYGNREDAVARILAREKAILKSEQHQVMRRTVNKDAAEQVKLCQV